MIFDIIVPLVKAEGKGRRKCSLARPSPPGPTPVTRRERWLRPPGHACEARTSSVALAELSSCRCPNLLLFAIRESNSVMT